MKIGPFWFHQKEQWDLGYTPWLTIHFKTANSSTRIFYMGRKDMNIQKCTFSHDVEGIYLLPLFGYSNINGKKSVWFGIWRYLWTWELS